MGNLTDFYLVAHSYGGYLMGTYASLYPQHIRKLILLSPLGLAQKPLNFGKIAIDRKWDEAPWAVRQLKDKYWGKIRPLDLGRRFFSL